MIAVNREDGHLLVAAVRVLACRDQSPPDMDQVAELLRLAPEVVRLKAVALIEAGILKQIESAWKMHLEVADHTLLESLPAAEDESTMDVELADFDKRKKEEAERMDQMFSDGTLAKERQAKLDEMDHDLFSDKPEKPANPFGD
jgi:hypothetical protein